jgi:hypothetical protein
MEAFLILIGLTACFAIAVFGVIKFIEAVWFFQEFRKEVTKSLDRIQETLRNHKP